MERRELPLNPDRPDLHRRRVSPLKARSITMIYRSKGSHNRPWALRVNGLPLAISGMDDFDWTGY